jgi:hypothetical protein
MNSSSENANFEHRQEVSVQPPISEVMTDPAEFGKLFPSQELLDQVEKHTHDVETVNSTLDILASNEEPTPEKMAEFYRVVTNAMSRPETKRVLLYLPISALPDSTDSGDAAAEFRETYRSTWYDLLGQADVRANFVDGDVLEYDRRPEDPERIAKAAHLAPWLVEKGILTKKEVLKLAQQTKRFPVLKQSFAGALDTMQDMDLLSEAEKTELDINYALPRHAEMTDISPARAVWLANRRRDSERIFFDDNRPSLHGELSANLHKFPDELAKIEQDLRRPELARYIYPIAIISGSRLKGYSRDDSDIDVNIFVRPEINESDKDELRKIVDAVFEHQPREFWLQPEDNQLRIVAPTERDARQGEEDWAHILIGGAWLGDDSTVRDITSKLLPRYFTDQIDRNKALQNIEHDILQYRLLHKGFTRHQPIHSFAADLPHSDEIDGESAFYDNAYRTLATRLFFEKVFMPKI